LFTGLGKNNDSGLGLSRRLDLSRIMRSEAPDVNAESFFFAARPERV